MGKKAMSKKVARPRTQPKVLHGKKYFLGDVVKFNGLTHEVTHIDGYRVTLVNQYTGGLMTCLTSDLEGNS